MIVVYVLVWAAVIGRSAAVLSAKGRDGHALALLVLGAVTAGAVWVGLTP